MLSIDEGSAERMDIGHSGYRGYVGPIEVQTATGSVSRTTVHVEARLTDGQQTLGDWFVELACIVPKGVALVSGSGIRDQFYFVTPKGNGKLVVGLTGDAVEQGLSDK